MADLNSDKPESLSDVFSNDATPSESSTEGASQSESSSGESTDTQKDESSPEDGAEKLPDDKGDESEDGSESPSKEKSEEEIAAEKAAKDKEEKPADDKAKAEAEAASKEEATFKQRFEATQKWGQELNQQNSQMRQLLEAQAKQLQVLEKKLNGTWTDDDEAALHKGEATEDVATRALQVGKAVASKAAAVRELGQEKVNAALIEFDQLFGNNPVLKQAVAADDSPVHAILHMMERHHFEKQYGTTPTEWKTNITKEVTAELKKSLRKEILEEIRTGKSKRDNTPETLANKGAGDQGSSKLREESPEPLSKLFD